MYAVFWRDVVVSKNSILSLYEVRISRLKGRIRTLCSSNITLTQTLFTHYYLYDGFLLASISDMYKLVSGIRPIIGTGLVTVFIEVFTTVVSKVSDGLWFR